MASFIIHPLSEISLLSQAVDKVVDMIRHLFGPETTFEKIDDVAQAVQANGSTLEQELTVLLGCSALKLETADRERFEAIAMMSCFALPLDRFIKFCGQF